jgi:hypothetical protein
MARDGYPIYRYVDDIRIVVPTEADARQALMRLACYLRELGLALNSSKTEIRGPAPHGLKIICSERIPRSSSSKMGWKKELVTLSSES